MNQLLDEIKSRKLCENFQLRGLTLAYRAKGSGAISDELLRNYAAKYQHEAAYQAAEVYAYSGDSDRAFQWLERAYAQRDGGLLFIKTDPFMRNIVNDPRFKAFPKKMQLPV